MHAFSGGFLKCTTDISSKWKTRHQEQLFSCLACKCTGETTEIRTDDVRSIEQCSRESATKDNQVTRGKYSVVDRVNEMN